MGDGIAEGKGGLGERVAQQQRGVATGGGQRGVVGLVPPRPLAELVVDLAPELLLESGVDERGGLGGRGRCEGRLFPALHGYYYYCCIEEGINHLTVLRGIWIDSPGSVSGRSSSMEGIGSFRFSIY